MDTIVRFLNTSDSEQVDFYERRAQLGNIVSDLIVEEDRTQTELDLAGNKIKRIHNIKSIACDVALGFFGTAAICSGIVLNLTSVVFCRSSDWDIGRDSEEYDITNTALGTSLCITGGVMFGAGVSRLWRHVDKKYRLDREKEKLEARIGAIERRAVDGTDEHAEHTANIEQFLNTAVANANIAMPRMVTETEMLMPPPYSETPQSGERVRRQLFSPERGELPSISELPEYGEHTEDRLLETGMIPR